MPRPSRIARTPASPAHSCSAPNALGEPGGAEHDVADGRLGREVERLRQRGDPQVAAVGDPAGVGLLGLGEQPQQGGLAGAVEADDADPVGVVEARARRRSSSWPAAPYPWTTRSRLTMLATYRSDATRAPGDRARARCGASRHTAGAASSPAAIALGVPAASRGEEHAGRAGAGDEAGERAGRVAGLERVGQRRAQRQRGRLQVVAERRGRARPGRAGAARRAARRCCPAAAAAAPGVAQPVQLARRRPGWTGRRRRSRPPSARWSGGPAPG